MNDDEKTPTSTQSRPPSRLELETELCFQLGNQFKCLKDNGARDSFVLWHSGDIPPDTRRDLRKSTFPLGTHVAYHRVLTDNERTVQRLHRTQEKALEQGIFSGMCTAFGAALIMTPPFCLAGLVLGLFAGPWTAWNALTLIKTSIRKRKLNE